MAGPKVGWRCGVVGESANREVRSQLGLHEKFTDSAEFTVQ